MMKTRMVEQDALTEEQALEALRSLKAHVADEEKDEAADRAKLLDLHAQLAEQEVRGNVDAIRAIHEEIGRVQEAIRPREGVVASLKRGAEAANRDLQRFASDRRAEAARGILAEINQEHAGTGTALAVVVTRLEAQAERQVRFDTERAGARAAATNAGLEMPSIGKSGSPFQAWASELRQILSQMEARSV